MAESAESDRYKLFFEEADTDKDGNLTLEELTAALRAKGYKDSDIKIKACLIIVEPFIFLKLYDEEIQLDLDYRCDNYGVRRVHPLIA